MRLMDQVKSLRDYTVQLREMFSTQLDIKMNRIMTVLTVVTVIFMPLTLIVGWYGMNFVYMPELHWKYSYLVVFIVSDPDRRSGLVPQEKVAVNHFFDII